MILDVNPHKNDCLDIYRSKINTTDVNKSLESVTNHDLLDQIPVPPLTSDERILSTAPCNGALSYSTTPCELGAVPEEDEEAATSSTPSTVVSSIPMFINPLGSYLFFRTWKSHWGVYHPTSF